ncbi:protein SODIUM POTASSIUM ROOT DEFECTIVE 3-like [Phalaenopsis equestris]|uniref:protein SODIUM POTASSIUM ROOT DEFECTIVE 3-like n=1 Tax=Phalaenopsis equestris TaxID=78828 RepID=UPI0009E2D89C|nr:protein SODIUM POTASSIUM ROOT DEFECTIVE 3-like [Phalaenopsis equestris]
MHKPRAPVNGRAADIYNRNRRRPRASNHEIASNSMTHSHNNRKSTEKQNKTALASPAGSSRCLLNDGSSFHFVSEIDNSEAIVTAEKKNPDLEICDQEEIDVLKARTSARQDHVVVLRVSLHCKGCEGKVKKLVSKMEGVTSFEIYMAKKKVTVAGNLTPLRVLSSVSKVKNAKFWPSPPRVSASF